MILYAILAYWALYVGVHLLADEPMTITSQLVKSRHEEMTGGGEETEGDGFAWAFHGLTKD